MPRREVAMRRVWRLVAWTVAAFALGGGPAAHARQGHLDEPDPCASAAGRQDATACWTREAERAEEQMRDAYEALRRELPARAAAALKKSQQEWLDWRESHLVLLVSLASPSGRHSWEGSLCAAIARRQLTLERARALRRLALPAGDQACPL